ncbi:uncharacterized protein [Dysidea avara]|uniref:uncharacterized protein isoform X2 n=1 Tax=Dysidea avara TaxID=196820 RepID=UPI00331EC79E
MSSYACRCYRTSASGMLNPGSGLSRYILRTISRQIRVKFDNICSISNKSMLQQSNGMLKSFSWEALWSEFQRRVPVLLGLLRSILPKSDKVFLGFVNSLLLKKRNQKMSLMQHLVSVLLYGNAAHKQIYRYLQPLMVCMFASSTSAIIDDLSRGHDDKVLAWSKKLKEHFQLTQPPDMTSFELASVASIEHDKSDEDDNIYEVDSIVAPSDISYFDVDEEADQCQGIDMDADKISEATIADSRQEARKESHHVEQIEAQDACSDAHGHHGVNGSDMNSGTVTHTNTASATGHPIEGSCYGFAIVGDNIDKNVRPSFQREDSKTKSLHYFHSYAVKNRVDISSLSDTPSSNMISPDKILPSAMDFQALIKDFQVLVSRMLVQHMERFREEKHCVEWHIPSRYSKEMSAESEVALGVQLKNEAKVSNMCHIVDELSKYVPVKK